MAGNTIEITEENFADTVSEGITILDFWGEWCGPCRMFGPIFEAAAKKHSDVKFGKVDTEAQQGIAAAFKIRSIPTVMVFRDNVLLMQQAGMLPAPALDQVVEKAKALDMDEVRAEIEKQKAENESEG